MMKKITSYIMMSVLMLTPLLAQQNSQGVKVVQQKIEKQGERLSTAFDIVVDDVKVSSNEMLIVTPVLRSNTSQDSLELDPVVMMGKTRDKVVRRMEKIGKPSAMPENVRLRDIRKNGTEQHLQYTADQSYSPWMRNASLILRNTMSGCADCITPLNELVVSSRVLPNLQYAPSYKLTFIVPEVEPVKARSDKHSATFNFVVNRYELLRDYKDNRSKFDEVDRIIREVQSDDNINITEFNIVGFASPEGSFPHNKMLAENRAKAFADYLVSKFNVERSMFAVSSIGEDWDGLRKAVEASSINDKDEILRIIDTVEDPDARDNPLKRLSGGATYRTLLNDFYPPLRRTEYEIAYVVRAFDVEEAKQVIKTNPKLLSMNEMFLVAETYPAGSTEFKEVFDIAVRMYPDSEIAIFNAAAAEIEAGHNDAAIARMEKTKDQSKMLNNLAVAYARNGDLQKALNLLENAASKGDADAVHNLEELKKHLAGLED